MTAMLNVKDLRAITARSRRFTAFRSPQRGSLTTLLGAKRRRQDHHPAGDLQHGGSTGAVEFDGKPLSGRSTKTSSVSVSAHVPQGRGTFTTMTVEENLHARRHHPHRKANIVSDIERNVRALPGAGSSATPSRPARFRAANSRCSRSPAP